MPVKLRLRRQGRKGLPHYSIVAADSRSPRDGKYIEKIGTYDPVSHPAKVYVDHSAALKWLKDGAQPTNTVRALLRHTGVTVKFALFRQGKSEEEAEKIFARWRAEKDAKKKKKVISVDVHGKPMEPVPDKPEEKKQKKEEPAPVAEAAPVAEEAPTEEAPKVEEAPAEEPKAEETPAEEPKAEEAPAEEPKAEEAPAEEPKAEEAPAEEPKAEEAPAEEPKAEEAPAEEPKAEEAPAEEPKAEEDKKAE